ncbi:MAG: Wzt carbohydrate-binding domain-containing protein [Chitinophagaceae bacterium]|nr:Wzt carbohydrate-binding domain-containing protein [Chitinophagaceae bacterium]
MKDVSLNDGRTVLFVSHNMAAVNKLCNKGLLMSKGEIEHYGKTANIVERYLVKQNEESFYINNSESDEICIKSVKLKKNIQSSEMSDNTFSHNESIIVAIDIINSHKQNTFTVGLALLDMYKEKLFTTHFEITSANSNNIKFECAIPGDILNEGKYSFDVAIFQKGIAVNEYLSDICPFNIYDTGSEMFYQVGEKIGPFRVKCKWSLYV